jgi:hypothetical protein
MVCEAMPTSPCAIYGTMMTTLWRVILGATAVVEYVHITISHHVVVSAAVVICQANARSEVRGRELRSDKYRRD